MARIRFRNNPKHSDAQRESDYAAKLRYLSRHVLGKRAFVLIVYAPWCGHCSTLKKMPEPNSKKSAWINFTDHARTKRMPVVEINGDMAHLVHRVASKHGFLANEHVRTLLEKSAAVGGYPTIRKVDRAMVHADYDGPRDSASLKRHLTHAPARAPAAAPKRRPWRA